MGCASTKQADLYDPAPRDTIAKSAEKTEGRQSTSASTASNVQEEELAAHQERDYKGSIKPACESERMCTLNTLAVLDTEPEKRFDDITKLCTLIFNVSVRGGCTEGITVHIRCSAARCHHGASSLCHDEVAHGPRQPA